MKRTMILLLVAMLPLLSGCAIFGTTFQPTKYRNDDIRLGVTKESVILRYGKPYMQELEMKDGKIVETIGYKEWKNGGFSVNTYFFFEDGLLVKKTQTEVRPEPSNTTVVQTTP